MSVVTDCVRLHPSIRRILMFKTALKSVDQESVLCFLWSTLQNIRQQLGWKMSTFKSEVVVCWKGVGLYCRLEISCCLKWKSSSISGSFSYAGGVEQEENRWTCAAPAVVQVINWLDMVNRTLIVKVKPSIYKSISVPTLTSELPHEVGVCAHL